VPPARYTTATTAACLPPPLRRCTWFLPAYRLPFTAWISAVLYLPFVSFPFYRLRSTAVWVTTTCVSLPPLPTAYRYRLHLRAFCTTTVLGLRHLVTVLCHASYSRFVFRFWFLDYTAPAPATAFTCLCVLRSPSLRSYTCVRWITFCAPPAPATVLPATVLAAGYSYHRFSIHCLLLRSSFLPLPHALSPTVYCHKQYVTLPLPASTHTCLVSPRGSAATCRRVFWFSIVIACKLRSYSLSSRALRKHATAACRMPACAGLVPPRCARVPPAL